MADKTISDLTAAASVTLATLIEVENAGPISRKATLSQVQSGLTGLVPTSRTIATTAPLAGGGDLSANRTFSIADAVADGATKGAAAFLAVDFTSAAGVIGIDYANGQKATSLVPGFLTAADWSIFNSKASNEAPFVDTTAIVKGSVDPTKLLRFEVDGFSGGATRVITPPNSDIALAGINIANAWSDDVTQTFNPGVNNSGINVGAVAADPGTPVNGDLWYQSTANELRARINGATVALGSGGSTPPFTDTNALVKGSVDPTKLFRFEIDGFSGGATRIATPPNQDFTIAGIDVAQIFSQKQTFTPPVDTEAIVVAGFSITGAVSPAILDLSGTWNTAQTPTAFKLFITDTASGLLSLLADFRVNNVSKFTLRKDGSFFGASGAFDVAANGSFSMATSAFTVAVDGSFMASGGLFSVDASGNAVVSNSLTFNASVFTITDSGTNLVFNAPISASNLLINDVLDPVSPQDAATKAYVDAAAGGGLSGTGTPEGVVTANVGVSYLDVTDTVNPSLWMKAVGSGNTGWRQLIA